MNPFVAVMSAAMLTLLLGGCAAGTPPLSPLPSSATPIPMPTELPGPELDRAPERIVVSASLARPAPPDMVAAYRPELVADHCADRDLPAPPVVDAVRLVARMSPESAIWAVFAVGLLLVSVLLLVVVARAS